MSGNITLDHQVKTHNSQVPRVEFLPITGLAQAHIAKSMAKPQWKDIYVLHADLGHPLDAINQATSRTMGLNQ